MEDDCKPHFHIYSEQKEAIEKAKEFVNSLDEKTDFFLFTLRDAGNGMLEANSLKALDNGGMVRMIDFICENYSSEFASFLLLKQSESQKQNKEKKTIN